MKHIVIVRTSGSILNLSSYNCQELGLAKSLVDRGYKVSLILAANEQKNFILDGVNVYNCVFISLNQQISWFKGVYDILKDISPDFIQVHDMGLLMTWVVAYWAKKNSIPYVLIQGNYQTTQKIFFKQLEIAFNYTFGRSVLKNASKIGCKTKMASKYVQHYYNCKTNLTYVGLDVSNFIDSNHIDWSRKINLINKKVLLYVGSIEERRNPIFLLDIVEKLPLDYVLIIVGDGSLTNNLKKQIVERSLHEKCILLGKLKQEELTSLYKIADLFLLASSYEIYGMVILESMYFGVPVLSSNTAGSETIIEEGVNGFVLNKFDVNLWTSKVLEFFSNSDKIDYMKMKCANLVRSKYLWNKAIDNFINLYKE